MLNYLYTILAAETRLALAAIGLDPGLGFLHVDAGARDSLAYDLMEPVRPQVDALCIRLRLSHGALNREWFFEERDGNCRLMARTCRPPRGDRVHMATGCSAVRGMGRSRAPEHRGGGYAGCTRADAAFDEPTQPGSTGKSRRVRRRRNAETRPRVVGVCGICGVSVEAGNRHCRVCQITFAIEQVKTASAARAGCHLSPVAQAQRSETKRANDRAVKNWDPARLPAWLTPEAYATKIQPLLADVRPADIMNAIGVSWLYASYIRRGIKRPHPRHWEKLADLVGVML